MKILRISNSKGEFSLDGINYSSVDTINKDDLLNMIDVFVNSECEMDEYSEENIGSLKSWSKTKLSLKI